MAVLWTCKAILVTFAISRGINVLGTVKYSDIINHAVGCGLIYPAIFLSILIVCVHLQGIPILHM